MSNILITGAAGFIGSNLMAAADAVGVDDFATANKQSIAAAQASGRRLLKGSITDPSFLKRALAGIETVFHQAAIPSVPRSVKDPLSTNAANVGGTLALLVACRDAGVKNAVFASSSSVYGDTPTLPKKETMQPNPKSPYAVSKLAGEEYMRVFGELYGMKTASLRYFNVFGPNQNPESEYAAVIPRFVKAAFEGKPLTLFGDGSQTRDFTFVKDVVEANKKAVGKSGVYNIAGGKQTSIRSLAEMIIELAGSPSKITSLPERQGDIKHSLADISKAGKELGWKPKYSLEQGLKEYISSLSK
jgi:nucleoside-diphosphate-sugar epimerase